MFFIEVSTFFVRSFTKLGVWCTQSAQEIVNTFTGKMSTPSSINVYVFSIHAFVNTHVIVKYIFDAVH